MTKLADIRNEYTRSSLDESTVATEPAKQFDLWLKEALEHESSEPTAMTLATSAADGTPCARIVLLKGVEEGNFLFYTNYESRKGQELLHNPKACLLFFWPNLQRQVRINGIVEKLAREESREYFQSRPRESRIGAWASKQSSPIQNRKLLEDEFARYSAEFGENAIPLPDSWGGYRLKPDEIEFWQGGAARLHDRIVYRLEEGSWLVSRLSP